MGTYLSSSSPRQMIMRCRYCLTPACSTEHWTLTSRACRNTGRGWRHVAEEQRHHSTHHYTTHWSLHLYTCRVVTKALKCRVGVQVLQGTKQHYYFTMHRMYLYIVYAPLQSTAGIHSAQSSDGWGKLYWHGCKSDIKKFAKQC